MHDPEWAPLEIGELNEILSGSPFLWWVSGGIALELHTGRSWRLHADIDVGLRRDQLQYVYQWLADWDLWLAAEGIVTRWDGRALSADRGENNVWMRSADGSAWILDLTIGSGTDEEWVYRWDESIRRPWADALGKTNDGVRYLAPDLQLVFKSKNPRPKDHEDARQVRADLTPPQRDFLGRHLPKGHPWA